MLRRENSSCSSDGRVPDRASAHLKSCAACTTRTRTCANPTYLLAVRHLVSGPLYTGCRSSASRVGQVMRNNCYMPETGPLALRHAPRRTANGLRDVSIHGASHSSEGGAFGASDTGSPVARLSSKPFAYALLQGIVNTWRYECDSQVHSHHHEWAHD